MNTVLVPSTAQTVKHETPISASLRLPSLDGWRAISIILVLGAHCKVTAGFPPSMDLLFKWAFDGDLGVRMFFIISGFLITWLMLKEQNQTGKMSLPHFYARRALRILPVYMAFLGSLAFLQCFTPYHQTAAAWARNLTFTTNFDFGGGGNWTSGHLWSLAVEEQFYFLWPIIFVLFGVVKRLRTSLCILSVPLLIAPFSRVITYLKMSPEFLRPIFSGFSFFNYFDSLAIGCACALLLTHKRDLMAICAERWRRPVLFVAVALIAIPYVLSRFFLLGIFTVPLGNTFQGVGMAMLMTQSLIVPRFGFYRILNQPLVCQVGVLSYSIYIWQQIFSTKPVIYGFEHIWWMSFPCWLLPVFAAAIISYYGLERPLFRLRAKFRD